MLGTDKSHKKQQGNMFANTCVTFFHNRIRGESTRCFRPLFIMADGLSIAMQLFHLPLTRAICFADFQKSDAHFVSS